MRRDGDRPASDAAERAWPRPGHRRRSARYLDRYGRMLLIRLFEDEIHRLFLQGEVHGTTHLVRRPGGRRRSASARRSAPSDCVAGTYRGHGHALACGTDPEALVAEMLGRATGVCGGRAGSMNVIDLEHGLIGCFGIVGGSIAAATGAAMSARAPAAASRSRSSATARPTRRYFHECLNFAAVVRAARRVRLREQPLRRVHADGAGHRRRRHRRPRGARTACPPRASTATTCGRSPRPRARRSTAPAAAAARRCSSARPTATTATRSPTRRVPPEGGGRAWLERDPLAARARAAARATASREDEIAAVEREVARADRRAPSRPRSPRRTPTRATTRATEFAP